MELNRLDQISEMSAGNVDNRIVVAGAAKEAVIEAMLDAVHKKMAVKPVLVGDPEQIKELLREQGGNLDDFSIVPERDGFNPAETAVELIKEGKANVLMKGSVGTSELLRPVVKRENGLRTERPISHVAIYQLPFYHKLLITSDCGISAYPNLEQKKGIILNVSETLQLLGYECPKIAVLCCKEEYDPKMPEIVEARHLQEMCERGEMGNCYVKGPISYDLAVSRERAKLKKFDCRYSGDFDALIVPNIHAGNILGKCLELLPGSEMCSYVAGAKIPIILTSRGAGALERERCIALAGLIASRRGNINE